jgi:MFS family permease
MPATETPATSDTPSSPGRRMPKVLSLARIPALASLRHRNYRIYWTGLLVAIMGWQVLTFTQLWLVYELTSSTVYVGLVGGVNGVCNICLSMFGGVFADRLDRRRLLLLTQSVMALLSLALAAITFADVVEVWHVLVIAGLTGATAAFDSPSRQALIPHLIGDRQDLGNAVALSSSVWSAARIIGPAIGGALIAITGPALCFLITAVAYAAMVLSLQHLRLDPAATARAVRSRMLSDIREGWTYVFRNHVFLVLIGMTFLNSLLGMSYIYVLPAIARDVLAVGSSGYGLLMTLSGIGAVCGTITVASLSRHGRRGWTLLTGSIAFGALLVAFGLSRSYALSLTMLGLSGFFNSLYMTNVVTLLQTLVPDSLRGRVMGIYSLTWSLMPLGGLQAGLVAEAIGAPNAVLLGGMGILVFGVVVAVAGRRVRSLA